MTDLQTAPAPVVARTKPPGLWHLYCTCSDPAPVALCGKKGKGATVSRSIPSGARCVVCLDLAALPCERCGR